MATEKKIDSDGCCCRADNQRWSSNQPTALLRAALKIQDRRVQRVWQPFVARTTVMQVKLQLVVMITTSWWWLVLQPRVWVMTMTESFSSSRLCERSRHVVIWKNLQSQNSMLCQGDLNRKPVKANIGTSICISSFGNFLTTSKTTPCSLTANATFPTTPQTKLIYPPREQQHQLNRGVKDQHRPRPPLVPLILSTQTAHFLRQSSRRKNGKKALHGQKTRSSRWLWSSFLHLCLVHIIRFMSLNVYAHCRLKIQKNSNSSWLPLAQAQCQQEETEPGTSSSSSLCVSAYPRHINPIIRRSRDRPNQNSCLCLSHRASYSKKKLS